MAIHLLQLTVLIYLVATGSFFLYLFVGKDSYSRISPFILLIGLIIHSTALAVIFFHAGFPALTQFREALSFKAWVMVGTYILVQFKYRLTVLGCFIAPLAFLMCLSALTLGAGDAEIPPALKTYWLPLHVTLAFLGNAVFALAFGVSVVYLFQEYELKNKKRTILHKRFSSLETLDRLNYIFLIWGFPLMTFGIITGSLWAGVYWGDYWSWEPRQISSAITWFLYGALLHGRITGGWRGKKAALWTIVGFAVVLSYFLLGDFVFTGRHAGRFE